MNDVWNELDRAAKANLLPGDLDEFFQYKNRLKREGHSWHDAHKILSGWIWDVTEGYQDDDM